MIDLARSVGRYGAYIWPAYGVSLIGLAAMIADTAFRAHRWRREADRRLAEPPVPEGDEL